MLDDLALTDDALLDLGDDLLLGAGELIHGAEVVRSRHGGGGFHIALPLNAGRAGDKAGCAGSGEAVRCMERQRAGGHRVSREGHKVQVIGTKPHCLNVRAVP